MENQEINEELIRHFKFLLENPRILFNNDIEGVKEFIEIPSSIESLELMLKTLENSEWYEACSIVKNKINELKSVLA